MGQPAVASSFFVPPRTVREPLESAGHTLVSIHKTGGKHEQVDRNADDDASVEDQPFKWLKGLTLSGLPILMISGARTCSSRW
jgi:hypothetical protein